ncbi:hypothetical protein ALP39_200278 [Pseudomonas marginalis pv. marginalis]|nr:hypothetical protein ALP39_200278 [Pseudomonas marginalis pv. marginalis]
MNCKPAPDGQYLLADQKTNTVIAKLCSLNYSVSLLGVDKVRLLRFISRSLEIRKFYFKTKSYGKTSSTKTWN